MTLEYRKIFMTEKCICPLSTLLLDIVLEMQLIQGEKMKLSLLRNSIILYAGNPKDVQINNLKEFQNVW